MFHPTITVAAVHMDAGLMSRFKSAFLFLAVFIGLFVLPSIAFSVVPWTLSINTNNVVNITDATYGATGDGVATNTTAIQNAIDAASASGTTNGLIGGTVEIPPGIFLSGPLTFKKNVNLQVDGGGILRMLSFGKYPVTWVTNGANYWFTNVSDFISGTSLTNIEISGSGMIQGQGEPWWPWANTNNADRPSMIHLSNCNREMIQNVTLSNSPSFHIAISGSANTTVQGVTIRANSSSDPVNPGHNTDACDVSGTNILVQNCNISVGDDDFTCGGGTSDVLITNNIYGTGHGVSIGSYTSPGVANITVANCIFNGTENGIRIKSDDGRGGLVQNINYLNLSMTNVHFPIQIYAYYLLVGTPSSVSAYYASTQAVVAVNSTPVFRDITFSNITATSVSTYPIGIIWARTEMPATNIVFNKVNITGDESFDLYNVSGAQFIDCNLKTSSANKTFALYDAKVIITNSAPTITLFTFDGLTTNGYGSSLAFYNAVGSIKNTNAFDDGPLTLSTSTFIVSNSLTLFPTTVLNYVLGTNAATVAVKGNLALGGTNNIYAGGGFTNGAYILLTYTGALSGNVPTIGMAPYGFSYAIDTNTTGSVKLFVTSNSLVVPLAPTNFLASVTNQSVTLTWSPSATATSYNVKRATNSGGTYATIANVAATNYSDAPPANGTTYFYVVSAINGAGEGTNSAEVSATPTVPVIFLENFSFSSLNAAPTAPSAASTSYELISAKAWSPTPSISSGHLKFGIAATGSGSIEVQALFSATPVRLATIGDTLSLTVIFTNTIGLLTQSGALGFGVYNSGQNFPVTGGMNGTETGTSTVNASGNAQTWMGYVGQLAFTGSSSQILRRSPQTGVNNNNQDLITTGGTPSYGNPAGSTIGSGSTAPSLTLVAGGLYTEVLTLKLTATNTLAITNFFYSGATTNAALLSQFGGVATSGNFLTNSFDALAIGWRATTSTFATAIDISQITVNASVASLVSSVPTNLIAQIIGNQLQVSWPADHLGWRLQIQTNTLDNGLNSNWVAVPNSAGVNATNILINPANGAVFLRLVYP